MASFNPPHSRVSRISFTASKNFDLPITPAEINDDNCDTNDH